MRTRPLLRNVRHRAMITPVGSLRTRLIRISASRGATRSVFPLDLVFLHFI